MLNSISREAEELLNDILKNDDNPQFCIKKMEGLSKRDDAIIRGCLKELEDNDMIHVDYADNGPYHISILKDGYLYGDHLKEAREREMSYFEKQLFELLERTKTIKAPINASTGGLSIDDYNAPAEEWMNDVQIFHDRYLKSHPLSDRINALLFHRQLGAYKELISCLKSIQKDEEFIGKINGVAVSVPAYKARTIPEYDVFISHANSDKPEIVDELNNSLKKLGVNIFYDKDVLDWGDKWKERIYDGTKKSEFAIIVISEKFFGREWTEKELNSFLNRQNKDGQKIILPILHNITMEQLMNEYPAVADIQAISSKDYSCDEIALLFAKQFIKRLKNL